MSKRFGTFIVASLLAATVQVNAQGHSDRALNYLLGQWYNSEGRVIKFFITRDIPKFSILPGRAIPGLAATRQGKAARTTSSNIPSA